MSKRSLPIGRGLFVGIQKGKEWAESVTPELAKLYFLKNNGSKDHVSWICHADKFFESQDTTPKDQLCLAACHVEGDMQMWFQPERQSNLNDFKTKLDQPVQPVVEPETDFKFGLINIKK